MQGLTGAPLPNPHRTHNDWTEDPWADPEVKRRRRAERNQRWIDSLSERDWRRLSDLVAQVEAGEFPARLDDLDAPIAVGACPPDWLKRYNGERFGKLRGAVLLAWPKVR